MIFPIALVLAFSTADSGAALGTLRAQFDARRLQTGEFIYHDSAKGKVLGESSISIGFERSDSIYHFSSQTTGYADQRWKAVASPSLTPVFAKLTFGKGADQPTAFQLKYTDGKVTGFALDRRSAQPRAQRPVNAAIDADTVDQRIDWATVMAFDLRTGSRFRFKVYDPATGSSEVSAQVGAPRQLVVPAGTFRVFAITYRVEKSTGAEQYIVYATESLPRRMVREDFPDGTVSELLERH